MSERKTKMRYDYDFLQGFCKENCVILTKDYNEEKVLRDTIIEAKCLKCDDICSKNFRLFIKVGCFCKIHTAENTNEKIKQNSLEKYGCEYPAQNKEVKDKIKATNLERYGCETSLQNKEVKEKIKATNLEKYGCEHNSQSLEIKEKKKKTCLTHFGVENPSQTEEIKQKKSDTTLKNYGVEYPSQNKEVQEKIKATNLEKYGCENALQNKEVREKAKATNLEKYGVEYPSQNKEVKEKIKATNLEKYGCEHPLQNAEVSEKASKNAYKSTDYVFPSGRIEKIQGYENYMLNDLLQKENVLEDDIIVNRSEVPSLWYEDLNGKKRRYFVDCFIKSQNRCIEAKSPWTAEKKQDCIYLKQQALKNAGYLCEVWIYDSNGEIVEKVL